LCLQACATHSSAGKLAPASVPYSLKQPCRTPQDIPDGDLTYDDALVKWAKDRASLDDCGIRQKALADAAAALEKQ
jgi:hypothetical protein